MSTHPTARESHELHEDLRNEAARRVRALAQQEQGVRRRERERLLGVLVQQPHHYSRPLVIERRVSPRRPMDKPDLPGHEDIGGFGEGFLC